jgi:hypothetical protein
VQRLQGEEMSYELIVRVESYNEVTFQQRHYTLSNNTVLAVTEGSYDKSTIQFTMGHQELVPDVGSLALVRGSEMSHRDRHWMRKVYIRVLPASSLDTRIKVLSFIARLVREEGPKDADKIDRIRLAVDSLGI